MPRYAANTEVTTERSRAEVERTLARYGADGFAYGWDGPQVVLQFRMNGRYVRLGMTLPDRKDPKITTYKQGGTTYTYANAEARWEQACRQLWRAMALVIKAKLEAVEAGISTFEREFMADTVMPNNQTVAEFVLPQLEQAYANGTMPSLLPGVQSDHLLTTTKRGTR